MKKALKISALTVGIILAVLVVGFVSLYAATNGEYAVPATVADDSSLPRLELNGYTFHAETFGDPANPTVIVLHGGPGGDYQSLLSLQALADEYFVVFYDQRGSGLSERVPADEVTYQITLQDLDNIVDHFGEGEPVHLVGHSWGGILASAYLGYAPEKVDSAVLAEPGFLDAAGFAAWQETYNRFMSGPSYLWLALRSGFEAQRVTGPDAYASEDYLVGVPILHAFTNHPDNPYHCPGKAFDAPMTRWGTTAANAIQSSADEDDLNAISAHAADYTGPVLFLAGECNTWIGEPLQAQHAALYPNAELTVIADAGHAMFWDNPSASLAAVRSFLGD